ncbi:L-glyceraldehyde 3-phosphate reductase [Demequina sp. B12]|uniref:L-glyceraldehyde 3-phosphate reductase n=1 Tax=Demequina sp. B12 TaxID=2992757 RepID=UPI00237A71B0|nr:L-glyceraldehyde 3-phosphate reductase [Demequina sp. B12]MDE0573926.1 L-glyceraldehyde 3-phosphate reductase [Demequina sp. B12]
MTYHADADRYDGRMIYRRTGNSGLDLPVLSLGLWHNFGDDKPLSGQREILRRAFDLGVTHFDLANNYGPPYGSAEVNFGRVFAEDLKPYRDQIVVSTKAGWDMWPGPYGQGGGGRKYVLASLDQSLARMGLEYVDIFYSHRYDPTTPLEETAQALDAAVRAGKALYVGISSYDAAHTREMAQLLRELGTPLLIHQPSYNMLNRWVETEGLLDAADEVGAGVIAFTALAQGMLTDKYLGGVPDDSRAAAGKSLNPEWLTDSVVERLQGLNEIAQGRGQSLAQMALAWTLRDPRVTSIVMGASSVAQLEANVGALERLDFSDAELAAIDELATDAGIDIWADARHGTL